MTEAEAEAAFEAMMRESEEAEVQRTNEDSGAELLVDKYKADLAKDPNFRDVFNPARDGDCLMRCAVKHDLSGNAAGSSGKVSGGGATGALPADALRVEVVDRVRAVSLAVLEAEADSRADAAAVGPDGQAHAVAEATLLRGEMVAMVKAKCDVMARPGVVMGEDELQALADVRQAPVEVRTIVCVQTSSDYAASLPPKTYQPSALPLGRARIGKGDTLVLLHELRAARMSHYHLIRFC